MNNRGGNGNLPFTYDANIFSNIFIANNSNVNVNVFEFKSGEETVARQIDFTRTTTVHEPTTSERYTSSSGGLPPHAQQMGAGASLLDWVNASASRVPLGQHRNRFVGNQPQVCICHTPSCASPANSDRSFDSGYTHTNSDKSFDSGYAHVPRRLSTTPQTGGAIHTRLLPTLHSMEGNQYPPLFGICCDCLSLMELQTNSDSINKVD